MRVLLLGALALLSGCVLFAEPLCSESACPDGYGCRADGACYANCNSDAHCQTGYYCHYLGACMPKCDEADCDGFACDTEWEDCHTSCDNDKECASDFFCCTWSRESNGQCSISDLYDCIPK